MPRNDTAQLQNDAYTVLFRLKLSLSIASPIQHFCLKLDLFWTDFADVVTGNTSCSTDENNEG